MAMLGKPTQEPPTHLPCGQRNKTRPKVIHDEGDSKRVPWYNENPPGYINKFQPFFFSLSDFMFSSKAETERESKMVVVVAGGGV